MEENLKQTPETEKIYFDYEGGNPWQRTTWRLKVPLKSKSADFIIKISQYYYYAKEVGTTITIMHRHKINNKMKIFKRKSFKECKDFPQLRKVYAEKFPEDEHWEITGIPFTPFRLASSKILKLEADGIPQSCSIPELK